MSRQTLYSYLSLTLLIAFTLAVSSMHSEYDSHNHWELPMK
jgi:hypothetical protein